MRAALAAASIAVGTLAAPWRAYADGLSGPALVAWAPSYNQHHLELPTHGSGCLNVPEHMPVDRLGSCGTPTTETLEPGRYRVSVENAAPFPKLADDSGHALFVVAVGSNADCFEEETTDDTHDLSSIVRCVAPETGENVDTEFDFTYRADSTNFSQGAPYLENFAYAHVERDGSLDVDASFNPMNLRADDIEVERNGVGDYTVVFRDLNPGDALLDPAFAPYSAIAQKSCAGDLDGGAAEDGCFRSVCAVRASSPGSFERRDTSVDVSCTAADGSPRDTAFRVFFGADGFTSQGSWEGGMRYGWLSYDFSDDALGCRESPDFPGTSEHETPVAHYPGFPLRVCHEDSGVYSVDFLGSTILPYSVDGPNFSISTLGATTAHCNVTQAECASTSLCGTPDGPETTRLTLGCYDARGQNTDTPWNLNVTY